MTVARHHHWIGGRQVSPKNEKHFEDLNPLDDSLYAEIAQGDPTDVAMAVETAHESFGSYRHSLPKQREAWLVRAAELLESRSSQFIDILIDEVGSPILTIMAG